MPSTTAEDPDSGEDDPSLAADLIDLAERLRSESPSSSAIPIPVISLLRLAAARPEAGEMPQLGRYVLQRHLGSGAYGAVWRARDTQSGRNVAIKVPHLQVLLQVDLADRFASEVQAMAVLSHPNITRVLDVYREDGLVALVMEYCPGPSLADWLAARGVPAPPRLGAQILVQLAAAVEVCHRAGVVHGDIKPSNVLLFPTSDGAGKALAAEFPFVPRLADFGLAVIANEPRCSRDSSLWRGTLEYMSPEQVRGTSGARGVATDIYSLGIVLYELLVGVPPFHGPNVATTLARVLEDVPAFPAPQSRSFPLDLQRICLKCLSKEPSERYSSAAELQADLKAFNESRPVGARPNSTYRRVRRFVRRRAVTTEAGLLTVAIHAGIYVWMLTVVSMAISGHPWVPRHLTAAAVAIEASQLGAVDALMIGCGVFTVARRRWAAISAAVIGLGLFAVSLWGLISVHAPVFTELHVNDDKFRVIVFGFLTVMFAIQTGASALAWLSMSMTESDAARFSRSEPLGHQRQANTV